MEILKKCVSIDSNRIITKIYSTATLSFKKGDVVISEGVGEDFLFSPEDYPVKDQYGFMYKLTSQNTIEKIPVIERLPKESLERRKNELRDKLNYYGNKISVDEKENLKIQEEKKEIQKEINIIEKRLSEQ